MDGVDANTVCLFKPTNVVARGWDLDCSSEARAEGLVQCSSG